MNPKKTFSPETHLKALLIEHLYNKNEISSEDTVINEFCIANQSGRADLVIAKKNRLFAYEIKSHADNLNRLEDQIDQYLEFFDKTIVIADHSHIEKIMKLLPKEVAVWESSDKGLKVIRRGKMKLQQNRRTLLQFMHATEILSLLKERQISANKTNRKYIEDLALRISTKQIRKAAIQAVKNRYCSYSKAFFKKIKRSNKVLPKDIYLLSPYLKDRNIDVEINEREERFWEKWKSSLSKKPDDPFLFQLNANSSRPIFGKPPAQLATIFRT